MREGKRGEWQACQQHERNFHMAILCVREGRFVKSRTENAKKGVVNLKCYDPWRIFGSRLACFDHAAAFVRHGFAASVGTWDARLVLRLANDLNQLDEV